MHNDFPSLPQLDLISAKINQLKSKLRMVSAEQVAVADAVGRITAQNITAFRDSPSTDVSAMDGYAVRWSDISSHVLPVTGTATAGSPPLSLPPKSAIRVFTGGPIPTQAQCVVRREDCTESISEVQILIPKESILLGQNIRRQGENAQTGDTVVRVGSLLSACRFAGAITFLSEPKLDVFRRVRIGIINTGDELIDLGQPIQPWQIRDSNGPFLESILAKHRWLEVERTKVGDRRDQTENAIFESLKRSDVVLLTGGVSMGDADYVPDSIQACGGQVVFHRIPIRPGRPMLGAFGPEGQLILGLPGNPLSVAVTFRRYALEMIQHVAGLSSTEPVPLAQLESSDSKTIDLTWFRLASVRSDGRLTLVASQGSGDIASLIQSDGFVEIPPNTQAAGTRPFYTW